VNCHRNQREKDPVIDKSVKNGVRLQSEYQLHCLKLRHESTSKCKLPKKNRVCDIWTREKKEESRGG